VVTDSRGKQSSNTATFLLEVEPQLGFISVGSRKVHGTAGPFDIDLPQGSPVGIECRAPGPNSGYQLIYTFNKAVTVAGSATRAQGTGVVGQAALGPNPNQITVNLTGVTNIQHLIITLNGVQDAAGAILNNLVARMDVLVGDTNADGNVDGTDVSQTKSKSGSNLSVTPSAFREDINLDGFVDGTDVSFVKSRSGGHLPPP
jgi:hypothetical protein